MKVISWPSLSTTSARPMSLATRSMSFRTQRSWLIVSARDRHRPTALRRSAFPCRAFAGALAGLDARFGAGADRYSFTVTNFNRLLLTSLPAHTNRAQGGPPASTDAMCRRAGPGCDHSRRTLADTISRSLSDAGSSTEAAPRRATPSVAPKPSREIATEPAFSSTLRVRAQSIEVQIASLWLERTAAPMKRTPRSPS